MVEDGEVERGGDSVEVIYQEEGNGEPKRIGFLVADANGAVIGSSLHDEDVNGEDNDLSVDDQLSDAKCDKEESCDGKAVFQEKSEDGSNHYLQVSIETRNTDSDIDEKMRDAASQLPEEVLASTSKCNESESHNINPEKEIDTTCEYPEDVSAGVGKRNMYGAVESTAEDTEIAGHADGTFEEEEEEEEEEENFGLMSAGAVDEQFDLPDEVQRNRAREEEESNLNESEEFSGDDDTDSDIDKKMRDVASQLPEDVLASISKCNESESPNINPEKEIDTTCEFPEDASASVGKRNMYGAVESTAEDTEIAGHADGTFEEEEEEEEEEENFGLMSAGAVDEQFDLPDEVQRNGAREEEEWNLNESEEFSGDDDTDSDIDEKMRDASSQLPEDVLASISKCNESENHNINPEKEIDTTCEFPEDVSASVGKRNTYGAVGSTAEDTEIAGYADGNFEEEVEEEEEKFGLMSAGAVDKQFDLPNEVQRNCAREEESNLNETEEFSGDDEDAISDTSSEEDLVPSIQLRSVEELLHKCVVQSTIAAEKSSPATVISSSSQSSTELPLPPCHPAGLGSSAPLIEPVSRAIQHSEANGIGTSCSSQVLETDKKEKDKVEESIHRGNAQSEGFCNSTSIERIDNQRYQPKKLDESSKTEAREKPSVATNKSGMESMADSSSGSSSGIPPPPRPAGLGPTASLLEPGTRSQQHARANEIVPPTRSQVTEETINGETGEDNETREKLQMIRVKFLRLANRLGQTPHNAVVAQVLYRLGLAEQIRGSRAGAFSFDRASAMAEQLEAAGQVALDFSCTIMVLGKTGVGKSATINSIFDEAKFSTNAFQMGTKNVQAVVGTVQGIKVRVIDTPGLLSSFLDQRHNEKILRSVKSFIKKTPPDIVLYLDRLDMQSRDYGDLPVLRTITDIFGPAIWFNAIVVLTHAASAPPEGPSGTLSYEMFVAQRSHVVQQAIRQAAGDMRLMNPVSLVENHSACRTNRAGQRVLPNGQVWKPHLLLLSFASKILSEANALLKLQTNPPAKPFGMHSRVPPLPFLLSSLLQSRPQLKLPEEQFGDEDAVNEDLDDLSDSDDECEYDELPPFKCLSKQQISRLNKEQRKAYFDELDYRERLFMKKQLKEEKKHRKLLKKMAASCKQGANEFTENMEEDSGGSATVPVPMPDMALPASFDSNNPTHRYRYLDTSNQWLVRPVFEAHGWDHDVGYEGLNIERLFVVKDNIPISISGQVTKDKKESNLQLECASSIKHGEGKATSLGFDMQTIGKDVAYTLRGETRFSNYRFNKAAAGLSVTLLGDALTAGVKFEDKLMVGKRFKVLMNGGAMAGRGNVAYGGSLEATLRDKDYPLGQTVSTLGLSVMDWHGDLAIGCNLQSQFPVGRGTNMIARANLNNRGAGQISIRLNSSEQFQIALIGLLPLLRNIINNRLISSQSMQ